jgi:O-antigen ligase
VKPSASPFGRIGVRHVIGGTAFLILPACVLSVPFAAPLLVAAAVFALALQRVRDGRWPRPPRFLGSLFAILVVYGALSSLWSVSAALSLTLAAQLAGLFAAGLVLCDAGARLDEEARAFVERAFLIGFCFGVVFLTYEELSGASIDLFLRHLPPVEALLGAERPIGLSSYFNRVETLVGLLVWPAAAIAGRRNGWLALALVLAAAVPVMIGFSVTAKVAYVAGVLVYGAARLRPRYAPAIVGVLVVLDLVLAPILMHSESLDRIRALLPNSKLMSLNQRLDIWNFAIEKIRERPILGWGLNSSRDLPGGHRLVAPNAEVMPLHPHDMALQLRLELGLPGLLLGIAIVLAVSAAAARAGSVGARAATVAVIAAAATNSLTGYDLWHPWWLSFLWLAAAVVNATERGPAA